jgi:DNA polymerase III delta prime subunit
MAALPLALSLSLVLSHESRQANDNFLSQGSPGIGKTTCVLALAREMLGESLKEGVLELNASDERYVTGSHVASCIVVPTAAGYLQAS